jgi:hypothetical protein
MYELDDYAARFVECEQRAKFARDEDDKHSWLAIADSWRQTAELQWIFKRQEQVVHKVVARAVTQGFIHAL